MTVDIKKNIDMQLAFNQSKNFFHKDADELFKLTVSIVNSVHNIDQIPPADLESLINYTVDKSLQELCRVNQYYSFRENDIINLKMIYHELYQNIIKGENPIDIISKTHYEKLRVWLERTNRFSKKMYQNREGILDSAPCSEYSAVLQSEILHLHDIRLLEPILDIGCGKAGSLVKHLREKGFEAYGIDRFSEDSLFIDKADWLTYKYGDKKWGTIVSNLSFSNHFMNNHLRVDGDYIRYAPSYMEILRALKPGGCFCYAPDLPFIETHLEKKAYMIERHDIEKVSFKTTIITKILS